MIEAVVMEFPELHGIDAVKREAPAVAVDDQS
jgi:hypothetical protein